MTEPDLSLKNIKSFPKRIISIVKHLKHSKVNHFTVQNTRTSFGVGGLLKQKVYLSSFIKHTL